MRAWPCRESQWAFWSLHCVPRSLLYPPDVRNLCSALKTGQCGQGLFTDREGKTQGEVISPSQGHWLVVPGFQLQTSAQSMHQARLPLWIQTDLSPPGPHVLLLPRPWQHAPTLAFCLCRFVVSCTPSWFWGPVVTLEDCLAAFFAADELKGEWTRLEWGWGRWVRIRFKVSGTHSVSHTCLLDWLWDCTLSQPHHLGALRGSPVLVFLPIWWTNRIAFFNFAFP